MKSILITGGCGFIGSHFVEHVFKYTDWKIIVLDKLTYASKGFERLRDSGMLNSVRVKVYTCDLSYPISDGLIREIGYPDIIVHMCAETHVDNSILNPSFCIKNNVMSTVNILEYARLVKPERFFYFSTDEVFGPAPKGVEYLETDSHNPTNPYSASKSAGESISLAYLNTFKVPVIIVNVMNAFGERQHVEKFIPKCIKMILNNERIPIHADAECKKAGSRFYIHARNISSAVLFLIDRGVIGEKYNISGEKEVDNLELAQTIAKILGKPFSYDLINFHESRPGHDLRYCLNGEKLWNLGWKLPVSFEDSLKKTIEWTLKNQEWLED